MDKFNGKSNFLLLCEPKLFIATNGPNNTTKQYFIFNPLFASKKLNH